MSLVCSCSSESWEGKAPRVGGVEWRLTLMMEVTGGAEGRCPYVCPYGKWPSETTAEVAGGILESDGIYPVSSSPGAHAAPPGLAGLEWHHQCRVWADASWQIWVSQGP